MYKFFVNKNQIENNLIRISKDDINHIKNVLRLQLNDEILICNINDKNTFLCKIILLEKETIKVEILKEIKESNETNIHINIFQGIPKFEKMELIIQKSTELGVKEITPVLMERSIVKINEKTSKNKLERWRKIAEISAKQSKRDYIPIINEVINIKNICNYIKNYDIVLLAYENENNNTLKKELLKIKNYIQNINLEKEIKIGIIIGPEGGIDKKEIETLKKCNIIPITLGKRILRTETVALVLTSIIMYELGEM